MAPRFLALAVALGGFSIPLASAADGPVDCAKCHTVQGGQWAASVHAAFACQECHGGEKSYSLGTEVLNKYVQAQPPRPSFDHGETFRGKAPRAKVPERCANCHSDVERMNPYGLRTDQFAAYWTSGHGKTLRDKGDDRVAVCSDCHGVHDILKSSDTTSRTHPFNVPGTCAKCHSDFSLMSGYELPVEIVSEYRESVHGRLLLEQHDPGAPTCATCHGNHSAMPPGFRSVGAVCGKCHEHASKNFETSVHSGREEFKGCVQCHGGGVERHNHAIERITKPTGVMLQRYAHLMTTQPHASKEEVTAATHPDPKQILSKALATCMDCHEDVKEDKSLQKLFGLLDDIAEVEREYLKTARRLDEVGRGVLLVDRARFAMEDAKTHLIELAPLQHTLDNTLVAGKVGEFRQICDRVNQELDELESGLRWRYRALVPIWAFAVLFAAALFVKYKRLRAAYVRIG